MQKHVQVRKDVQVRKMLEWKWKMLEWKWKMLEKQDVQVRKIMKFNRQF